MTSISVLLATNRLNDSVIKYMHKAMNGLSELQENTFTEEFHELAPSRLEGINHILEPTLRSLDEQTFKDFELIISHRYPGDAKNIIKELGYPIKLVKEKPSIWHDIHPKYHTVANNKNTAFINSSGELIYHIDDLTFFNKNLLKEAWDLWRDNKYMTGRTVRCITYDKEKFKDYYIRAIGPNKIEMHKNGWKGQQKPLTGSEGHPEIPMYMFWTCSASVSAEELLEINGYDELYDGSLTGIDMEAGARLDKISKYKRVASDNYLYEINDPTPKYQTRDDVMMRKIWRINYIKANSWKPTPIQVKRYKRWHESEKCEMDPNWNKFMDVPLYNLKRI